MASRDSIQEVRSPILEIVSRCDLIFVQSPPTDNADDETFWSAFVLPPVLSIFRIRCVVDERVSFDHRYLYTPCDWYSNKQLLTCRTFAVFAFVPESV